MPVSINGNLGITFPDGSLQVAAASPFGLRNRIINGDMVIDQRRAGASVTNTATGLYTLDRWQSYGSQASKFTIQQNAGSVTPPAGFTNYLGITSSSAYTVGSSETFVIFQYIEGYNVSDLDYGKSTAKTITLSFWVRSSLTGTFGGALRNSAENRSCPFSYTISSANTWEQKSITITGDTSGTWLTTNGTGLGVLFSIGTGSTLSGTAGTWAGSNYISATGATSVVGTNGATFYITGVQLERNTTATPFEWLPYSTELALCQRYYYRTTPTSGSAFGFGWNALATVAVVAGSFPVPMRVKPSALEQSGTAAHYQILHGATATTCSSVPVFDTITSETIYSTNFIVASGLTAGQGSGGRSNNASAYLGFSAEL